MRVLGLAGLLVLYISAIDQGGIGAGCGLLYFPIFVIWDYERQQEKKEPVLRSIVRRLLVPGIVIVFLSYLLALLFRWQQQYGILYIFHFLMGHTEHYLPDFLWVFMALAEVRLCDMLLDHYIQKPVWKRFTVLLLFGTSMLLRHMAGGFLPLYLDMGLLGVVILQTAKEMDAFCSSYLRLDSLQKTGLGCLLFYLSCRISRVNTELVGTKIGFSQKTLGNILLFLVSLLVGILACCLIKNAKVRKKRQVVFVTAQEIYQRGMRTVIWIGLALIPVGVGLQRIWLSDYSPINGDFQNYNVWRRLLDGQIPVKDFAAYLGMGHLYIGGFLTYLAGGSFTDSMFVSNLLNSLVCLLFLYAMLYFILQNRTYAIANTVLIAFCVYFNTPLYQSLFGEVQLSLRNLVVPVTDSMRLLRALVSLIMLWAGKGIVTKLVDHKRKIGIGTGAVKRNVESDQIGMLLLAALAGGGIAYSNDVGVASYISFSILFVLFLFCYHQKALKASLKGIVVYGMVSFFGFIIAATLFTRGHLLLYLQEMLGTASYQKWYYNCDIAAHKITNLSELYFDRYAILAIALIGYNVWQIYRKRKEQVFVQYQYGAVAYLLLTAYISATFYLIQSGRSSHGLLYLMVFCALWGYGVKFLSVLIGNAHKERMENIVLFFLAVTVMAVTLPAANEKMRALQGGREGVYYPVMEGYLRDRNQSVADSIAYVGEDDVFSTYASALEVETGRYQPTGRDYIIHAMGDIQQEKYLEAFRRGAYPKVQTIDFQYDYGIWMMNANWYFYRELFRTYEKTWKTQYSQFWEPAQEEQLIKDCQVEIKKEMLSDTQMRLYFSADQSIDAVADVSISYKSSKTEPFWKAGNINLFTHVYDNTLAAQFPEMTDIGYFIQNEKEDRRIPVVLEDGNGCITITVYPQQAAMEFYDAEVMEIYPNCIVDKGER